MSVLLDVDPWGTTETMSFDADSGMLTIARTQDIGAILDNNAEMRNTGFSKRGEWWPIASVPETVMLDWLLEYRTETGRYIASPYSEDEEWNRWVYRRLDSNEFFKLRTGEFRIGA